MNDINFLNSFSEKKQIIFYQWIRISCFLICSTIVLITILQIKQIYYIKQLKNQKLLLEQRLIKFDDTVQEKNKIKTYKNDINNQLAKFQKKSKLSNNAFAHSFLKKISLSIPDDLYLQAIEYNSKTGASVKGFASATQAIISFVQNLNNLPQITNVKLEYLRAKNIPEMDDYQTLHEFSIKLKLKKNLKNF